MNNKQLIKRYPFLEVTDTFGEPLTINEKNIDITYLDFMPIGWKKNFALDLCEELRNVLIKGNYLQDYKLFDVKEKYGTLRWYDNSLSSNISEEVDQIIYKYERKSAYVCQVCGADITDKNKNINYYLTSLCRDCEKKYFSP